MMRSIISTAVVMSIPVDGGTAKTLYQACESLGAIAVGVNSIYFVNEPVAGQIHMLKLPIAGGGPPALATLAYWADSIALDARTGRVYWTEFGNGRVMGVPTSGGTPRVIWTHARGPDDIVARSGVLYWTNSMGGTVRKLDLLGALPIETGGAD